MSRRPTDAQLSLLVAALFVAAFVGTAVALGVCGPGQ